MGVDLFGPKIPLKFSDYGLRAFRGEARDEHFFVGEDRERRGMILYTMLFCKKIVRTVHQALVH
jgi:hypothetical protein